MKKYSLLIYYILFIIYEEIIFIFSKFGPHDNILLLILFSIPIATIFNVISLLFKIKLNKIIVYIITSLVILFFCVQAVYYSMYESILSIYSIIYGGQVFEFIDTIMNEILKNWYIILLFILPIVILIILNKKKILEYKKYNLKEVLINFIILTIIQIIAILFINFIDTDDLYSNKNLYYNIHMPKLSSKNMGILTTTRLDLQRFIFGFEENLSIETSSDSTNIVDVSDTIYEKEYNILDIDFDSLIENEKDEEIKQIHEYIKRQEPTEKNIYTGMFEGKNIIAIVGESFSTLAIREDLMPNLYKLYNEGFRFDNFYTPLFPVSTADGEYITDTSLIPKEGVWSFKEIVGNYMPYSYANVFESLGYTSNSYHNHSAKYYQRDKYLETMGYDSYLAKGNGLEKRMNTTTWPESDYEMFKTTIDDYINNEKFLAYYMTVSGHLEYTKMGNCMARKNWDLVKDLPYSEKAKGYLAANIELDKAVGELLNRLESSGKLEDTVIIISGDHYPYGLNIDEINELSTYTRDDTFEKYRMPLLIWSGLMKEPIKIEKIGSSLDILPTVLNLFGIEYDSRLLMGRDILSEAPSLVILSDRSFITDKGKYNSITGEFILNEQAEIDENYIKQISNIIYEKYKISTLILENDYYRKVFEYYNQ